MTNQRCKQPVVAIVVALTLLLLAFAPTPGTQSWLPVSPAFAASPDDTGDRQSSLDLLFRKLETAVDRADAQATTGAIWEVWLHSGDPAVDEQMREVVQAMGAQRFIEALLILDDMVEKVPEYAEAWNKRATVNYLVRRYDASLHDIEKTLALEPRHFGALAGKASIHTHRGEKKAAIDAMERALRIHPFIDGAKALIEQNGGVYRSERGI